MRDGDRIVSAIRCRGCGATGEAAWDSRAVRGDFRQKVLPLSVSGGFYFHESPRGTQIACAKCQQFLGPD